MKEVYLLPLSVHDWELVHELYSDEEIFQYAVLSYESPPSREAVKSRVEAWITSGQKHYLIAYLNEIVGLAQIYQISQLNKNSQMGILIKRGYTGRGVGTEVLKRMLHLCFSSRELNLHKVEISISSENYRSIHFFESNGFVKEGVLRESIYKNDRFHDRWMYGLLKRDWITRAQEKLKSGGREE